MRLAVIAYLCLVLAPAAALAVFALGAADRDHDEGQALVERRREDEAQAIARRVQAALEDAAQRGERHLRAFLTALERGVAVPAEFAIAFVRDGEWFGFAPPRDDEGSASAADQRSYALSVAGGEHYEFGAGTGARERTLSSGLAVDAYAFYLPRIAANELRDRLRFRLARAAAAGGRTDLATRVLRDLARNAKRSRTEEGLPIPLLAALRLLDFSGGEGAASRFALSTLREALDTHHPELATRFLERVVDRLGAVSRGSLARMATARRALRHAAAQHPKILRGRDLLAERDLIVSYPLPLEGTGDGTTRYPGPASGRTRAIVMLPADVLETLSSPDYTVSIASISSARAAPGSPSSEFRSDTPVRLRGETIGSILLVDPEGPARLARLGEDRGRQRTFIALLGLSTLAGGAALFFFLQRQRRLAALRAQLLANVSHELKTPATSIRMFSEMLATEEVPPAKAKRFAELVHTESLRLGRVIQNVLDFSRFERRGVELAVGDVDLHGLIERITSDLACRAREENATLDGSAALAVLKDLPVVRTDGAAVERILVNLIDNALKYRRPSGAVVKLTATLATRTSRDDDGTLELSVSDNGPGIAREDRARVFEEFYRARFEDYGVPGTGLGLPIARQLARRLGGDLALRSKVGVGSTFTLSLPTGGGRRAV